MAITRIEEGTPGNAVRPNVVAATALAVPVLIGVATSFVTRDPLGVIVGGIAGIVLAQSPRVARQWERGVVLRLGRDIGLRGPGLFWVMHGRPDGRGRDDAAEADGDTAPG